MEKTIGKFLSLSKFYKSETFEISKSFHKINEDKFTTILWRKLYRTKVIRVSYITCYDALLISTSLLNCCYKNIYLGLDPDDIMATNMTDQRGHFFVRGNESEWSTIDPVLIVRHKCNDGGIVKF